MKILVTMYTPRGTMTPEIEARIVKTVESYSSNSVQVTLGFPEVSSGFAGRGLGGDAMASARNHLLVAERMIQAEKEGFDACIPYGMMEFGVELARTKCSIPIVGQARAAYCMAALMTSRWGIITYRSDNHSHTFRQVRDQGFEQMLVGLGAVGMAPTEMWDRSPLLLERFAGEGQRLVREGAALIVCHGMSMSPVEFSARELGEAAGVPVLEGMGCALAMAQAWVRTGTPYSAVAYPREE